MSDPARPAPFSWFPRPTGNAGRDRHARTVHLACLIQLVSFSVLLAIDLASGGSFAVPALIGGQLGMALALALNWRGHTEHAARLVSLTVLAMTIDMVIHSRDGFRSIVMLVFPQLLVLSLLLLEQRSYRFFAAIVIAAVSALGLAEVHQLAPLVPIARSAVDYATVFTVALLLLVTAVIGSRMVGDARLNLLSAESSVRELATSNSELRLSEQRYRSLIDLAVDAILIAGPDGRILESNHRAHQITGRSAGGLAGRPLDSLFEPAPGSPAFSSSDLRPGSAVVHLCLLRRPDGSALDVELLSGRMSEGLIQCFCRDITERRRTEQEVAQLQKMESIGRLAGGVAHDFNNLLTVISGYGDLLAARLADGSPERKQLAQILSAASRAAELTAQLLAFSRKQAVEPEPVDLNHVVSSTSTLIGRLIGDDIRLETALDPALPPVLGNEGQISQVLMNLAVNARDAMPAGGLLRLSTTFAHLGPGELALHGEIPPGSYARLTVADSGCGMDESLRARIFEPFFTTKGVGAGTGLGLSVVLGIVEQAGGSIRVDSEPGHGTTFTLWFPLAPSSKAHPAPAPRLASPAGGRETILLVEDRDDVRRFAAEVLRTAGYDLLEAADGAAALALVEALDRPLHLLLTDLLMPGMNGAELAAALHSRLPGLRTLYASGHADPHILPAHPAALLPKPYSPRELLAAVREALS